MLEIAAQVAKSAGTDTTAAWITAGATGITAFASTIAAVMAARAQRTAAQIASSGAIRGAAMDRWAKHQDTKRDLYSRFEAAAWGNNADLNADYDLLHAQVRKMTTPKTRRRIDKLGDDPREFPQDKRRKLEELLTADITMHD